MNDIVDYIINNTDIVEIIGNYIKLDKKNKNCTALCPFHKEKTPSFNVNQEKKMFYCFGCKEGGNVINFVRKYNDLSFIESIEEIAQKANLDISMFNLRKTNDKNEKLYSILRESSKFYHNNLLNNKEALDYLKSRCVNADMIKKFGIGFASDTKNRKELYLHLKELGFEEEDILKTNICFDKYGFVYDFFKNRITLPIFDHKNRIVGFGARVLDNSNPKYLNSSDSTIFHKSNLLYGFNFALKNRRENKNKSLILVEGYFDVISLNRVGIENAVASLGTALNKEHINLIEKYFEEVIFCFDSDNAGQNAIFKSLELFDDTNLIVKVFDLKNSKDPDEFLKRYGKNVFDEEVLNARENIDFRLDFLKKQNTKNGKVEINKFVESVYDLVFDIKRPLNKQNYLKKFAKLMDYDEKIIFNDYEYYLQNNKKNELLKIQLKDKKLNQNNRKNKIIYDSNSMIEIIDSNQIVNIEKTLNNKNINENVKLNLKENMKDLEFKILYNFLNYNYTRNYILNNIKTFVSDEKLINCYNILKKEIEKNGHIDLNNMSLNKVYLREDISRLNYIKNINIITDRIELLVLRYLCLNVDNNINFYRLKLNEVKKSNQNKTLINQKIKEYSVILEKSYKQKLVYKNNLFKLMYENNV